MSSSLASTSATPSNTPTSGSNTTGIAVGVSLGLVALLAIGALSFWIRRRRRLRVIVARPEYPFSRNTVVDPSHPACHVTPFGAPGGDTPRFIHQPGANMRVAHRRDDGGWEFSDMTSDTASSFDLAPPRLSLSSRSTFSLGSSKDKLKPGELTTRGYVERDVDDTPPPAYTHVDGSSVSEV
ncbi:hypothetical protein AcV5_003857 [Taiwanofungus camphoratus]|nr:hypothetical protein AcV5_003857 [Antrodia cinnamomea]